MRRPRTTRRERPVDGVRRAHDELLRTRSAQWGELPQLQPLCRCVEHVCYIIIVACQGGLDRKARSYTLSEKQIVNTVKKARGNG